MLVLAASASTAFAWLTLTDLGGTDLVRAIAVDWSGNVAVAGVRDPNPTHFLKYDSSGNVLWNTELDRRRRRPTND